MVVKGSYSTKILELLYTTGKSFKTGEISKIIGIPHVNVPGTIEKNVRLERIKRVKENGVWRYSIKDWDRAEYVLRKAGVIE